MDALDGSMARLKGISTPFGAFLDSVTDRYAEMIILGGLLFYYLQRTSLLACLLVFLAAMGSIMTSYVKARAESLGFSAKVGILTRIERVLVLAPCLLFNILWSLYGYWPYWEISPLCKGSFLSGSKLLVHNLEI